MALALDFSCRAGDDGGLGAGLECGPVLEESSVAVDERLACRVEPGRGRFVDLAGGGEDAAGVVDVVGVEQATEPVVDGSHHRTFLDIDGLRVVDLDGGGVLGGEPTAVVGVAVVGLALHAAATQSAGDEPGEGVPAARRAALGFRGPVGARGADELGGFKRVGVDDRLVHVLG